VEGGLVPRIFSIAVAATSALVWLMSVGAPSAGAVSAPPELTVKVGSTVTWAQTEFHSAAADRVVIKVYARTPSGLKLWQSCRLGYAGVGIYGCGIDVAAATRSFPDVRWIAKLKLDAELVDRTAFSLTG
jgi:plastocyanin